MRLFCFGFGYTASYFAHTIQWESVYGTHRDNFPLDHEAYQHLKEATHVLISIPPNEKGDLVLAENYWMNPEWVGYLSTTGVYGNHDGGWVDENTAVKPTNERSKWRVKAEDQWLKTNYPVHIFRLSGIYGPGWGRNAISELKEGTAKRIIKDNQFFSRMHVEDIANVLARSVANPKPGEIYNCADDLPCSAAEVVEYAANLIGIVPPPPVNFEDAKLSDMARSFYMNSRRVKNGKIKKELGVKLRYPSYKQGLEAILKTL